MLFSLSFFFFFFFLLSLKSSKQFLLSLPPGQNCGNDKSLSPKHEISESESMKRVFQRNYHSWHSFFLIQLMSCRKLHEFVTVLSFILLC